MAIENKPIFTQDLGHLKMSTAANDVFKDENITASTSTEDYWFSSSIHLKLKRKKKISKHIAKILRYRGIKLE